MCSVSQTGPITLLKGWKGWQNGPVKWSSSKRAEQGWRHVVGGAEDSVWGSGEQQRFERCCLFCELCYPAESETLSSCTCDGVTSPQLFSFLSCFVAWVLSMLLPPPPCWKSCLMAAPNDTLPGKHCMHFLLTRKVRMFSSQKELKKCTLKDMWERFRTSAVRHFYKLFAYLQNWEGLIECKKSLPVSYIASALSRMECCYHNIMIAISKKYHQNDGDTLWLHFKNWTRQGKLYLPLLAIIH